MTTATTDLKIEALTEFRNHIVDPALAKLNKQLTGKETQAFTIDVLDSYIENLSKCNWPTCGQTPNVDGSCSCPGKRD